MADKDNNPQIEDFEAVDTWPQASPCTCGDCVTNERDFEAPEVISVDFTREEAFLIIAALRTCPWESEGIAMRIENELAS